FCADLSCFPYTTLFRSGGGWGGGGAGGPLDEFAHLAAFGALEGGEGAAEEGDGFVELLGFEGRHPGVEGVPEGAVMEEDEAAARSESTRLNSSHVKISY